MNVEDVIKELQKKDKKSEVFIFFKTQDGKCFFTSDVTNVSNGAIVNEYGQIVEGVLIMKDEKS